MVGAMKSSPKAMAKKLPNKKKGETAACKVPKNKRAKATVRHENAIGNFFRGWEEILATRGPKRMIVKGFMTKSTEVGTSKLKMVFST